MEKYYILQMTLLFYLAITVNYLECKENTALNKIKT